MLPVPDYFTALSKHIQIKKDTIIIGSYNRLHEIFFIASVNVSNI